MGKGVLECIPLNLSFSLPPSISITPPLFLVPSANQLCQPDAGSSQESMLNIRPHRHCKQAPCLKTSTLIKQNSSPLQPAWALQCLGIFLGLVSSSHACLRTYLTSVPCVQNKMACCVAALCKNWIIPQLACCCHNGKLTLVLLPAESEMVVVVVHY